eukprot:6789035-Pyramimonas_sp.AAC.1
MRPRNRPTRFTNSRFTHPPTHLYKQQAGRTQGEAAQADWLTLQSFDPKLLDAVQSTSSAPVTHKVDTGLPRWTSVSSSEESSDGSGASEYEEDKERGKRRKSGRSYKEDDKKKHKKKRKHHHKDKKHKR